MSDLILYLGITAVGYFIGSRVRKYKDKLSWTGKVQTVAITCLVLLMGMRMGSNREITENLKTIGITAFVITVCAMVLSIAAITLARKVMGIDRYGRLQPKDKKVAIDIQEKEAFEEIEKAAEVVEAQEESKKGGMNVMTLLILGAVIAGMLIGYFVIRSAFQGNMESFDSMAGLGIKIGLCLLLLFVGIDLGLDGTVIENFRKVGFRILVFPAVVVLATLVGASVSGMLLGLSFKEAAAVGAGFGWYTLAPGIIMEAGYLTASAVSFLHNVMRELFSILLIPMVAQKIGYIETTGMPGAAAMDVCLPIVEKSTRSDIAVYSFVSGVILSILVPVLVPLIIG
ncbi:MAG: lysine exporter LysO family protein [Anaerovoracaceae bacterium]